MAPSDDNSGDHGAEPAAETPRKSRFGGGSPNP